MIGNWINNAGFCVVQKLHIVVDVDVDVVVVDDDDDNDNDVDDRDDDDDGGILFWILKSIILL